jgi:mannose-1-phosphate guanylyltransferase/phosphomannomutase
VQAVIMAGGRGQRLEPLTLRRPKPLVPFFGRPLLRCLLEALAAQGVDEVFVTAGHLGGQLDEFARHLDSGPRRPLPPVRVVVEPAPRGTAGAVRDLLPYLRSPFAVVSGDAVVDLDLRALADAHARGGYAATICLAPSPECLRFGTVDLAGERVLAFREKPAVADLVPGLGVNTGCYVLEREVLEGLDPAAPLDFGRDVFPALVAEGRPVGARVAARFWRDIGTLDSYRDAHLDSLAGRLPWPVPAGARPRLGEGATVVGPVHCGEEVVLEAGARVLGPAVLGAGCRVGREATVARSVLLPASEVGARAVVLDSVLDEGARVPAGWYVRQAGVAAGDTALAGRGHRPARDGVPAPDLVPAGG